MAEPPVADASPLIVLARAEWMEILLVAGERLVVPRPVAAEVFRRGPNDPAVRALTELAWLEVLEPGPFSPRVLAWDLDLGETAVLSWALAHPGAEAIIDDKAGRRCAESLGIPIRGTVGLILEARHRGVIAAARPVIDDVRRSGLYLSDRVVNEALRRIGE